MTNGDTVGRKLAESGIAGDISLSADLLHEGPCPTATDEAAFRETRARYLAEAGYAVYEEAFEAWVASDAALLAGLGQDEIVLWFEHDLFDQLQLLRLLAWFRRHGTGRTTLSIICLGAYPGVSRFDGLGQLSPAQLRDLFPTRRRVTEAQLALGAEAWRRFGADDPGAFAALLHEDTQVLPFLDGAVRLQLEELPSTRNGLSRPEHQGLAAVAAGAADLRMAFRSTQEMEERVFLGDLAFARAVRRLAEAELPLVRLDAPDPRAARSRQALSLTALGREVLAGRADHPSLNGVDRWVGGVHLHGRQPAWRWEVERGEVVPGSRGSRGVRS